MDTHLTVIGLINLPVIPFELLSEAHNNCYGLAQLGTVKYVKYYSYYIYIL